MLAAFSIASFTTPEPASSAAKRRNSPDGDVIRQCHWALIQPPSSVTLDTGERIPADLALVGLGIKPATDTISGLPCNDDESLSVDAQLRVADALYAAGDIARFPVEHWRVAQQHGRTAALAMMGKPVRYDAVPVFWTIQ